MKQRYRVTLDLHPRVAELVEALLDVGLFGISRTKVVEGLFLESLRAKQREGWCAHSRRR